MKQTCILGFNNSHFHATVHWSGGGFAEAYEMPDYQKDVVSSYLRQPNVPPKSYFNDKGRGTCLECMFFFPKGNSTFHLALAYPDISAVGVNYQIVLSGALKNVSGTSCSTPCTAGIFSLLNDLRFKRKLY